MKQIGFVVLVIMILAALAYLIAPSVPSDSGTVSNAEDAAVRQVVTEFGLRLKMVPLLAPTPVRQAAMEEHYSAYVAPELLSQWFPEGAPALGRYASSPWPEKIDIVEVREVGGNFVVEANVIEMANAEAGTQLAAVQPVTLSLEKRDGRWLIVKMEKGAYSELPQRRTIIGYWECLPHRDRTGPQTMECAFGIAVDQSDGHYAVNTSLMSTYPVDFPTGTRVRVTGIVTPVEQLSSIQKYDIDGIISATEIEKI
jgi:hypothetical protein